MSLNNCRWSLNILSPHLVQFSAVWNAFLNLVLEFQFGIFLGFVSLRKTHFHFQIGIDLFYFCSFCYELHYRVTTVN